ncbi:MAG TPA: ABC transporter ATP-binding protein [Bacillota bacterium]|nr:ABC transporter ATP-binding protein [Bacillota bacterium]
MMNLSIQTNDLSKYFGANKAVQNLDLEIGRGEIFAFLGPNGAGKTTTIKMLTGLLEPTSGEVILNGVNIWEHPIEAKKQLAYVPDHPNLYPKLTGREYIEFIASVYQVDEDEFTKDINPLLDAFTLRDRADELIESYSHGMKQKTAICGALIHRPEVLFLDEPTVGLDPKSARELKDILTERAEKGMTTFMSTHILEIAEQMCDRIGIIYEGDLTALGTMEELQALGERDESSLEDIFLELTSGEEGIVEEIANKGDKT